MPWKETNVVEERMKFIVAWKQGGWTKSDLCREFGISRVTGDKYIKQYKKYGIDGLKDKSHATKNQPNAVRQKLIDLIINLRKEHPSWGARKLLPRLQARYPGINDWPSESTTNRILRRNGLIAKKKRF
jgi:transposase